MTMKRSTFLKAVVPSFALTMTAAGCGSAEAESAEKYPSRPIQVIVSFAAGGGTDLGARQLMPLVEKELGADIQVVNRPGAGGWVGWEEAVNADPDAYTLAYLNTPNLVSGYLNPELGREHTYEDFTYIANQVTDPGTLSIRTDEDRFTDLESLIEYAKANTLTTTSTGVASDDHIAALRLNAKLGTKFEIVHTEGASEGMSSFLGGHIDVLFNNVGEAYRPHEQGELITVGVMAAEPSSFLPDVTTFEEAGYGPIYSGSSRGIGAPAGLPEDIHKELAAAFEKAINSEEHKELMAQQGLQINYLGPEEYKEMMHGQEAEIDEVRDLLGWSE